MNQKQKLCFYFLLLFKENQLFNSLIVKQLNSQTIEQSKNLLSNKKEKFKLPVEGKTSYFLLVTIISFTTVRLQNLSSSFENLLQSLKHVVIMSESVLNKRNFQLTYKLFAQSQVLCSCKSLKYLLKIDHVRELFYLFHLITLAGFL